MDCFYSELYFKSIAHRAQRGRANNAAGANGKLVFDCVEKAKLILRSANYEKNEQGVSWLQFAPVRYYHRLIYSSVMLIKVLRDPDWSMLLANDDCLSLLQATVTLLYYCAPDDLHLSRRYSILLESLIKQVQPQPAPVQQATPLPQFNVPVELAGVATTPGAFNPYSVATPYAEQDAGFTLDFLDTLLSGQGQGWA